MGGGGGEEKFDGLLAAERGVDEEREAGGLEDQREQVGLVQTVREQVARVGKDDGEEVPEGPRFGGDEHREKGLSRRGRWEDQEDLHREFEVLAGQERNGVFRGLRSGRFVPTTDHQPKLDVHSVGEKERENATAFCRGIPISQDKESWRRNACYFSRQIGKCLHSLRENREKSEAGLLTQCCTQTLVPNIYLLSETVSQTIPSTLSIVFNVSRKAVISILLVRRFVRAFLNFSFVASSNTKLLSRTFDTKLSISNSRPLSKEFNSHSLPHIKQ